MQAKVSERPDAVRATGRGAASIGRWAGPVDGPDAPRAEPAGIAAALGDLSRPVGFVEVEGRPAVVTCGTVTLGDVPSGNDAADADTLPVLGYAPALHPSQLGDRSFCDDYGTRFAYMTGAMANGIASVETVIAAARAGCLGAYGAAGQSVDVISAAIDRIQTALDTQSAHGGPYAFNLIHSPNEPAHEQAVVDLYIARGVHLVEASAYLGLTPAVVRYRLHGIYVDDEGNVVTPNRVIAKASRIEVATRWFSPPPQKMVDDLVAAGHITPEQAELSQRIPMAQDLTAEADSGGHTDNRPAITLIPTMLALRDRMQREHRYGVPLRVGAAGGIATPSSAAAAFAMGASYIVTGTVNQACVESGSSDGVRQMLAETEQADVTMAPAADMFEMGVKLQVLKRGTMFAMRAGKLFELYRAHDSLDAIPATERASLEKTVFRAPLDEIWRLTAEYFGKYDPAQVAKADSDPKHKMALTFRWYLGLSSRWANAGDPDRRIDYQVWCGPAMGAFNEWTADTFLAKPEHRTIGTVAWNLLHGAAVQTRINALRSQGVRLDGDVTRIEPKNADDLQRVMD
ncbi:MAG: PfaD family polyunsaturated fatty acid/polyketide biosynthesis protein [Phycisphaera sp.]|nr:PfaD family polyunsaturated fatty acid/polyketide biosynthesis protein [Phycisphaera sp.]